jgi:hypothetical protein
MAADRSVAASRVVPVFLLVLRCLGAGRLYYEQTFLVATFLQV